MRTAVVSDLHLGIGSAADLLRRDEILEALIAALDGTDRVVLLGDVLELRDRPLTEALAAARPVLGRLGTQLGGAEIVVVPGNHDHHLIEEWLLRRAVEGETALELEHRGVPETGALATLAEQAAPAPLSFAYPGIWLRDDVYATHGHYLDRHQTIPTLERLGVGLVERLLGTPPGGPDPLAPPEDAEAAEVAEYERVQAPVYAFLFALAQATVGERSGGADPSVRVWQMLSGKPTSRTARVRGWLLGSVAIPGAVGVANRLGLGPVGSDLSPRAITSAALAAMSEVIERLRIDADHVIFGHTHRRGPNGDEPGWEAGETRLWNTGSWVHSPALLGPTAARSPYWPGTVGFVDEEGPPRLLHLLDDLSREQLAGTDSAAGIDSGPGPG
ncbi:MAG: metallophosphoesterase [Solirubrobacterales bacterium]